MTSNKDYEDCQLKHQVGPPQTAGQAILNICTSRVELAGESPRLVIPGEVLREGVQLPRLVVIHPLGLLLHWLGSVSLVDLQRMLIVKTCSVIGDHCYITLGRLW